MDNSKDIRWKQRFQNFDRAFVLLRSAFDDKKLDDFSELEQEGIIQRFEFTFELAWKTLKDYLENSGIVFSPATPRNVIKEAFNLGILPDGQLWIDMMLHRNILSHNYDFSKFKIVLEAIAARYLNAFEYLHEWFTERHLNND
ncbi:MAG: nucleotidyltransferase substrate binding protein [Victivallales bacterium]